MQNFPKISIITPSYNQEQFLEQTMLSVLGQNYPNLEYIIIDGGSTDNSVEIIKRYENKLAYWISEKDEGQASAINKGFERATGDIFCWLNSDDMFMPGTFSYIANQLDIMQTMLLTGSSIRYWETAEGLKTSSHTIVKDREELSLNDVDYIMQPSTFWTKKTWGEVGKLNEQLHYTFDWEWFLRAELLKVQIKAVNHTMSIYRIHDNQKTFTGGDKRALEIISLYNQFSPENIAIFKKLILNKGRLNNLIAKVIKKILKTTNSQMQDVALLKILFPEFRKIDNSRLRGIYLATI